MHAALVARPCSCVRRLAGTRAREIQFTRFLRNGSVTATEMAAVLEGNPFRRAEPKYTYVVFLDRRPPRDALAHAVGRRDEEMRLGDREIFVHYPSGMGRSKLKIPAARLGTARNMNTVAKLTEIAAKT